VEPLHHIPGAEPGVDPRRESIKRAYAHIHEECEVEVIDYSAQQVKFQQFNNESFLSFLDKTDRSPPMKVRWINVGGISWDIISVSLTCVQWFAKSNSYISGSCFEIPTSSSQHRGYSAQPTKYSFQGE
jgi:hypothetical protein